MDRRGVRAGRASVWLAWVVGLAALAPSHAAADGSNVVVAFTTTNATPLNPGFAGFSTEMLANAIEYSDTNLQASASTVSPGWLRYPSGALEDAFGWTNGETVTNWISQFPSAEQSLLNDTIGPSIGKGGVRFPDFAAMCQQVGGAKMVVTVNGFTDSAASAGAFAGFALSNHLPVAIWELCNEPYVFAGPKSSFFLNSTDYVAKMKPYRDAIKAADSNAVVAIYFSDAGFTETNWDTGLASYSDKYWDAVVYHHYPEISGLAFADQMALDNWELASNTTARVEGYLMPKNDAKVVYEISEFAPSMGNGAGGQNPPTATLYGGVYAAEYVLRLSTVPQMQFVGPYQLLDSAGINLTNTFRPAVSAAYQEGRTTNTAGLPFGFFLSAQGCGSSVANWALARSIGVYPTTVGDNGPTVPVETNGAATIPAIYAQAYAGGNGRRYVVLTNKGSNAAPVQIVQDGAGVTNAMFETFITGDDPTVTNAPPPASAVVVQSQATNNPVILPEFSVVRLEWTVFEVPPPVLRLASASPARTLQWVGLTNVSYWVQAVAKLGSAWATVGKVTSTTTNFTFTDPDGSVTRFYRTIVP